MIFFRLPSGVRLALGRINFVEAMGANAHGPAGLRIHFAGEVLEVTDPADVAMLEEVVTDPVKQIMERLASQVQEVMHEEAAKMAAAADGPPIPPAASPPLAMEEIPAANPPAPVVLPFSFNAPGEPPQSTAIAIAPDGTQEIVKSPNFAPPVDPQP